MLLEPQEHGSDAEKPEGFQDLCSLSGKRQGHARDLHSGKWKWPAVLKNVMKLWIAHYLYQHFCINLRSLNQIWPFNFAGFNGGAIRWTVCTETGGETLTLFERAG